MRLGLLLFCIVTPRILAQEDNDGNNTIETTTYVDDTRRGDDAYQLQQDHVHTTIQPSVEKEINKVLENATKNEESTHLRISDQISTPEQIENNNGEPCDNAQFLMQILTVMLPLLKKEIPETDRTSYVLQILRHLLKSSPETAQDHEVMYKINDLLETLEKYQVKGLGDQNVLRDSGNALTNVDGVKTKIVFKYEMPHFQNPNCTAELLTIIKVVQQALLRLVNNPLCNSKVTAEKWPQLTNIDGYFKNSELHSYLPNQYPSNNEPNHFEVTNSNNIYPVLDIPNFQHENFPPIISDATKVYPGLEIDFPEKNNVPDKPQLFELPLYKNPHYPYDASPSIKKPSYANVQPSPLNFEPYIYYPDSQKFNKPTEPLNLYDSSPSDLPLAHGDVIRPVYPNDVPNIHYEYVPLDETTHKSPFVQYSDTSFDHENELRPDPTQRPDKPPYIKYMDIPYNNYAGPRPTDKHLYKKPHDFAGNPGGLVEIDKYKYPHAQNEKPTLPIEISELIGDYVPFGKKPRPISPENDSALEEYYPIEVNHPSHNPALSHKPEASPNIYYVPESSLLALYGDDKSASIQIGPHSDFKIEPSSKPSSTSSEDIDPADSVEMLNHVSPKRPHKTDMIYESLAFSMAPTAVMDSDSGQVQLSPYKQPTPVDMSSNKNDISKYNDLPSVDYQELRPKPLKFVQFDVSSKAPTPFSIIDESIPSSSPVPFDITTHHQPNPILEFDSLPPSSSPSTFETIGDYGAADIDIGQNQPNPAFEFDLPSRKPEHLPFEFSGSPNSAYIPFGKPSNSYDLYFIPPDKKKPIDFPNEYDSAANSLPTVNGQPDLSKDNPPNYYKPSSIDSNTNPNIPGDYLIPSEPYSPFEVAGHGSEEIQFTPQYPVVEDSMDYIPKPPTDNPNYYPYEYVPVPAEVSNPLINDSYDSLPYDSVPEEDSDDLEPDSPNQTKSESHKPNLDITKIVPYIADSMMIAEKPDIDSLPHVNGNQFTGIISDDHNTPDQEGYIQLKPQRPNKKYYSSEEIIISEPITPRPSELHIMNQYTIPGNNYFPYKQPINSDSLSFERPDSSEADQPSFVDNTNPYYYSPDQTYQTSPDTETLTTIADNIEVIESKIPEVYFNADIREHIKEIKKLLELEEITVEEYVELIQRYEMLIKLIKRLNISDEALQDLLLGMTNGGKLKLQTGKSHVIELTYLIKRPKPLIYHPYYYIKYRLPYESFKTRLEKILELKPHLSQHPSILYKELIPISKITETSPDLEGFGKEDILKIVFNNGTLVGAKLLEGKDSDMYKTLDDLNEINSEFTIEDIYQLITNLDTQLKKTPEDGLVIEHDHIPATNIEENVEKLLVKVKKRPVITKKITKITSEKIISDKIVESILNRANHLRTNVSAQKPEEISNMASESDNIKTNNSAILAERSRDMYHVSQLKDLTNYNKQNSPYESVEESNKINDFNHYKKNINDGKFELAYDYLPLYSDTSKESFFNVSAVKSYEKQPANIVKYYRSKFNKNEKQLNNIPSSTLNAKLLGATLKAAYKKQVNNSPNQIEYQSISVKPNKKHSYHFTDDVNTNYNWQSPATNIHSSIGSKLLDATIKAQFVNQRNDPNQFYYNSKPLTATSSYTIDNPSSVKSHLEKHTHTYVNGIPVAHSHSYTDDPKNIVNPYQLFDTYNVNKHIGNIHNVPNAGYLGAVNKVVYKHNLVNPYYKNIMHTRLPHLYQRGTPHVLSAFVG